MIKYLILSLFIISNALSAEKVSLIFKDNQVKQGSIVDATIAIDLETSQNIGGLAKLKDVSLGETFYIVTASPSIVKMNEPLLKSEAKIIVQKLPEAQPVRHNLNGKELEISWGNIEFIPTEAAQGFIFGEFDIPARLKLFRWIILAVVLIAGGIFGFYFSKRQKIKKQIRLKKLEIKDTVISAHEFSDVVKMWQKKSIILKEFPAMEEHFRKLETVLFKYQFKPVQTETEKSEVMSAYREFVKNVEGGFNGI